MKCKECGSEYVTVLDPESGPLLETVGQFVYDNEIGSEREYTSTCWNCGWEETKTIKRKTSGFASVIFQIVLVDAVFSFDSILTAVGLVDNVVIMIIAVIISIGIMMLFAGPVTRIINMHPTLQMLALSFLVVIGVVLIAGGLHQEVSKGIIYSCLGFSLIVEMLNIRLRKNSPQEIAKRVTDDPDVIS